MTIVLRQVLRSGAWGTEGRKGNGERRDWGKGGGEEVIGDKSEMKKVKVSERRGKRDEESVAI